MCRWHARLCLRKYILINIYMRIILHVYRCILINIYMRINIICVQVRRQASALFVEMATGNDSPACRKALSLLVRAGEGGGGKKGEEGEGEISGGMGGEEAARGNPRAARPCRCWCVREREGGGDTGWGRGDRWVGGWGELGEKMSVGGG